MCVDSFCIADPCFGVTCDPLPNGDQTVCDAGTCVRACDQVTCGAGEVCNFTKCEAPGSDCKEKADCPEDQYCELSLGEPVMMPDPPGMWLWITGAEITSPSRTMAKGWPI